VAVFHVRTHQGLYLRLFCLHRKQLVFTESRSFDVVICTIAVLFNPILPVRMARSDWQATNVIAAVIFIGFSVYLNWDSLSQRQSRKIQQTRLLVRTVAKICGRMHGQEIRILELDPADSALSDFFVITTAADHQHAITIANEIELRLKNDWGLSQLLDGALVAGYCSIM